MGEQSKRAHNGNVEKEVVGEDIDAFIQAERTRLRETPMWEAHTPGRVIDLPDVQTTAAIWRAVEDLGSTKLSGEQRKKVTVSIKKLVRKVGKWKPGTYDW